MDQSKKTMRHIYCRDALWETFEQMANDFDCSIDFLINEAMSHYARSKESEAPRASSQRAVASTSLPPPLPKEDGQAALRPRSPAPPPMRGARGAARTAAAAGPPSSSPMRPQRPTPPSHLSQGEAADGPTLYLVFNKDRIAIDKDQFIIGRGAKSSDLAIKDTNVSRQHAAVIRRDGRFYIKDLGSTNGIEYQGARIDHKRIDEGDIFHICAHELRFTYR
jgi:hypothetical protein